MDLSLPAERVIRALEQISEWRSAPKVIRSDNGQEYISGRLNTWAEKRGIRLKHIQPGNPQQNAYIGRYNRTVRHDWLGQYLFDAIEEAQEFATCWRWTYAPQEVLLGDHHERPNMAPGGITPTQKLALAA